MVSFSTVVQQLIRPTLFQPTAPSTNGTFRGSLALLPTGRSACVRALREKEPGDPVAARLRELGFAEGERVMITARSPFGGDPMVVRIGATRFALRRSEAERIAVESEP